MKSALRITVSTFGIITGLVGIEHGIGELLQGNKAPTEIFILSWRDSEFFRVLGGEPAMTLVPNFLISGILTILVSLAFLSWVTLFIERKHSGLILLFLAILMLLVGGGFGPPLLGIILGLASFKINTPIKGRHTQQPGNWQRFMAKLWIWSFTADLIAWIVLLPGVPLLANFIGTTELQPFVPIVALTAIALLITTIITGIAYDKQHPMNVEQPLAAKINKNILNLS
jgi:hypothetical protein